MEEIPYGKYIDSNINHDLPLSTEIIPYKAIKIDTPNIIDRDISVINIVDPAFHHTIVHINQRDKNQMIKCNCDPTLVKWIVISSFTISILFVFVSSLFSTN